MSRTLTRFAYVVAACSVFSCRPEPPAPAPGARVKTCVSIPPQAYFVERVGGEHVEVMVLVGPGQSPHTFEPTPRQAAELAACQVYFRIGMPFEKQLVQKIAASFQDLRIVDNKEGIPLRRMTAAESVEKEDADHVEHDEDLDPHVWMSPRLAKTLAATIRDTLVGVDPAHQADYAGNYQTLAADLDACDARIARVLEPLKGREIFVFHPAFGYFADAYGLRQVAVAPGGREPSAKHLGELIDQARKQGVRVIFVQPQFARKNAEVVAEAIGGAVVPMDDLSRDYLPNLLDMAAKVEKALTGAADGR